MIRIDKIGFYAHWVDLGRKNIQNRGFSQTGPLDWVSHNLANAICGMPRHHPTIEILGAGFTCCFTQACCIAVSGAANTLTLNGVKIEPNMLIQVGANDTLNIDSDSGAMANYLAIRGKFDLPMFANSVCAVPREKIGGIHKNGQGLKAGDSFAFNALNNASYLKAFNGDVFIEPILSPSIKDYIAKISLSHKQAYVDFCYQSADFPNVEIKKFLARTYTLSTQFDRMGIRLNGTPINTKPKALRSQAIVYGAIQIPGNGLPIIMRNDRQTIGGYPIIACVDRLSMSALGQAVAGNTINFAHRDMQASANLTSLMVKNIDRLCAKQNELFLQD